MLPKTLLLRRIPFSNTTSTFCPKSTQTHHPPLNFDSSKDTQNEGNHAFGRELKCGGAHNKAQTRRQNTPLAHLDPLSVPYPLTPSLTLTLSRVRRYHAEHKAKSGSPAASPTAKRKRKEGQIFQAQTPKKEGKSGSSAFPTRTKPTNQNSIHSNYVFDFILFFVYLFFCRCHLTRDKLYNR